MSLVDILNNSINHYDDTDPKWRIFISDHKQYLIGQSTTYNISTQYIQTHIYSLKRYLRSINYNIHCAWIIALINNIPTDFQFTSDVKTLYIPSIAVIESLYTNYITTNSIAA